MASPHTPVRPRPPQDSTLNGQQWGEGMDAYFSLMLRQSPKVADELRPLLLRFALWTLK